MSKKWFLGVMHSMSSSVKKHSPEILTGVGIAGMVTTTVFAVRATPKALTLMGEEIHYRIRNNPQDDEENIEGLIKVSDDESGEWGHYRLPAIDLIKTCWRCYIPATVTGVMSIVCLVGASSVNLRRNAALATAYALSESALKEYQEKVIETIGEKKEESIRDSIAKDRIDKHPVIQQEIIITDKGETLCFDSLSGRYFKSDIDKIKKSVNELNRQMLADMYVSLNDFYYELGLENTKLGDDLGWHIDDGLMGISFSSQLANGETPCLVLDYQIAPQYDYQK